jgi:general secretion pathway protein G
MPHLHFPVTPLRTPDRPPGRPDSPTRIAPSNAVRAGGFTIIEAMVTIAVIALLSSIAIPMYRDYQENARVLQAANDIGSIAALIQHFFMDNRAYPADLGAVNAGARLDPWGRPYVYFSHDAKNFMKAARRDKNFKPLNSDFDVYSVGKDGASKQRLDAKESLDDVVRAVDGRFIGRASDFNL